jgi:diadenylate cyclase
VFERSTPLGEVILTGTKVDATVSAELVGNVFYPKSPLHDGGMVIRDDRIASAGCILPLTSNNELSKELGTRHRAAVGMSETSDAIVVVVSEETGGISVAFGGQIERGIEPRNLLEAISKHFANKSDEAQTGKEDTFLQNAAPDVREGGVPECIPPARNAAGRICIRGTPLFHASFPSGGPAGEVCLQGRKDRTGI